MPCVAGPLLGWQGNQGRTIIEGIEGRRLKSKEIAADEWAPTIWVVKKLFANNIQSRAVADDEENVKVIVRMGAQSPSTLDVLNLPSVGEWH